MKKFEYMKRLYSTLSDYVDPYDTSDVVVTGTTSDFDRLFELSWKTMKEYLHGWLGIPESLMDYCRERGTSLACFLEGLRVRYGYASNEDLDCSGKICHNRLYFYYVYQKLSLNF